MFPSSTVSSTSTSVASIQCHQMLSPPAQQLTTVNYHDTDENTTTMKLDNTVLTYVPTNQVAWHCTFSYDGNYLAACFGGGIGYEPTIRIWKKIAITDIISTTTTTSKTIQKDGTKKKKNNDNRESTNNGNENKTNFVKWELYTTLSGVHDRTIRCVAFAPIYSQLILASASFDGTIAIWEEEEVVVSSSNNTDMPAKKEWICSAQLEGHENEVKCVAWNATGSLLASCGRDKTVWIWECYLQGTIGGSSPNKGGGSNSGSDFECLAVLNGHTGDVKCVMFAPSHGEYGDGASDEILLSASYDDTILCWAEDASTGDWYCVMSIAPLTHTSTIWTLALAPSGTRLLSGSADGTIAIYKSYTEQERKALLAVGNTTVEQGTKQKKNKHNNHNNNNHKKDIIISENGGIWKCVGRMPSIHDIDNNSNTTTTTTTTTFPVYSISYASTKVGHCRVASCGADGIIIIYRESAISSTSDAPIYEIECTSTSSMMIINDDDDDNDNDNNNTNNNTDDTIETSIPTVDVNCVCWHPTDGSILASASDDGVIRIWNYSSNTKTNR